jgi:hypothetical protein
MKKFIADSQVRKQGKGKQLIMPDCLARLRKKPPI